MKIFLMQHGLSKSKEEDGARPLNQLGIENTEKMGKFLQGIGSLNINEIYHSGKQRALETAQIIHKYMAKNTSITIMEGLNPKDDIQICIKEIMAKEENPLIVGHLPHLSKLTSYLLDSKEIISFQNSGCLCLNRDAEEKWHLLWYIVPNLI